MMHHAITIGDVLVASGVVLAVIGVPAIIFLLIAFFNPFRSGH